MNKYLYYCEFVTGLFVTLKADTDEYAVGLCIATYGKLAISIIYRIVDNVTHIIYDSESERKR